MSEIFFLETFSDGRHEQVRFDETASGDSCQVPTNFLPPPMVHRLGNTVRRFVPTCVLFRQNCAPLLSNTASARDDSITPRSHQRVNSRCLLQTKCPFADVG